MLIRLRAAAKHAPRLEQLTNKLFSGHYDRALQECNITLEEIETVRNGLPKFWRALEESLGESTIDDGSLHRILRYLGRPNDAGCTPWRGATSGRHSDGETGTPVISVNGKTQSVRRLLWNDRYPPGQPEHLGTSGKTRLRNVGCALARNCMTLSHWYKPAGGEAGGHDYQTPDTTGEAPDDTLRRIWAKTEPRGLCVRWLGAMAGNTPVISYHGKTVVARRLLWNLSFPERPLDPNERLTNEGCGLGSECMVVTHWRVSAAPIDRMQAWAALQNMPAPDVRGKPCQSGAHWIRDDATYCAPCRVSSRSERVKTRRVGYELGRAIRGHLRRSREAGPDDTPAFEVEPSEPAAAYF